MFSILNDMFSTTSNGTIYFKSQYSSSNFSVARPAKPSGHHPAIAFERSQNAALNTGLPNKPLSSRNSAIARGFSDIRKSKYSIVKTGIPASAKKNVYKWENKDVKSESVNRPVISAPPVRSSISNKAHPKVTSNIIVEENIAKNHYRSSTPFHSLLSKGWFSAPPCSTLCIHSSSFDLQSCCFISKRFLPVNTLSLSSFQVAVPTKVESKKANIENTPSFLKLTKHQLIRKPQPELPNTSSSVLLCTKRKLIRESAPSLKIQNRLPSCDIKSNLIELKNSITELPTSDRSSSLSKKKCPTLPLLILTDRKLIRETEANANDYVEKPSTATSPTKLIRVNRNKLIRSSLLKFTQKSTPTYVKPVQSVLSQMIQYRRRPYPGTSYVLLTRNKLVRRVRYKNEVWKKNADGTSKTVTKKILALPKVFVSVGKNKLIRKSLFTKTNKVSPRNSVSSITSLRSKMSIRMVDSPSKRVQKFTNHMSRRKLKYLANSSTCVSRNRFSNKCKINRRCLRKKNSVCPVFRRSGECHKKDIDNCPYLHDAKYIMICKNYLKSCCENENCLLSHDLIPQKVPVCLYFLKGNCEASQCPFSHVKLDSKSPICAQFLRGYCEAADKCTSWHVYACPQYKSDGKCDKGDRCGLPHRESEYFEGRCSDSEDDADDENVIPWRYFEKNKLDEKDSSGVQIIPERGSLGILPDYIPL